MSKGGGGPADSTDNIGQSSFHFKGVPLRVDAVRIQGLSRTKDDYVGSQLKDLFKVNTFEDLLVVSAEIRHRLEKLDCFRDIAVVIDTNKCTDASPNGYEVTFRVREIRRFLGGINTMVGANEGSLTFGAKLPNMAGRGEKFSVDHTLGSLYNKTSTISFMKPFPEKWNAVAVGSIFHQSLPNAFSNYNFKATGGRFEFNFESSKMMRHAMQYEGSWRQLEPSARSTSFTIKEQSGHSFKSALRHIMTLDLRDDSIFPTGGILLKLIQEFAGVGGDVAFIKHDAELQINTQLPFELVAQGSFRVGVLRPLGNSPLSHNVHDLFFLGGPCGSSTLRGFNMRSIGCKSQNDILGGRAFWSSGFHIWGRMPGMGRKTWADYFRAHAFFNIGNIAPNSFNPNDFGETYKTLLTNFRAAYGLGIALRLGSAARIELNYCFPLVYLKSDSVVHGIQLGLGADFL